MSENQSASKRFFVVEDHTLTNRGIRELLSERGGFECAGFAFSKAEYLEQFALLSECAELPDVLILDLSLRGGKRNRRSSRRKGGLSRRESPGVFDVPKARHYLGCA